MVMTSATSPTENPEMADFPGRPASGACAEERFRFGEMAVAVGLFLVLLALKLFYVTNQPWDSDESQHLHVVWAWANGLLPYKDVFDNHAPLFQALSAPVFALFGDRADIVTVMRWAITPVAVLVLLMTCHLGRRLFSRRVALWGTVLAACFPNLYFKLDEYRPDLFWAAVWLVLLAILTGGKLTPRRLFWAGFALGVGFSVSMKTTFLLMTVLLVGGVVWLVWLMVPELQNRPGESVRLSSFIAPVVG